MSDPKKFSPKQLQTGTRRSLCMGSLKACASKRSNATSSFTELDAGVEASMFDGLHA